MMELEISTALCRFADEAAELELRSLGYRYVWVRDGIAILDGDEGDLIDQANLTKTKKKKKFDDAEDIFSILRALDMGNLIWRIGREKCPWPETCLDNFDLDEMQSLARAAGLPDEWSISNVNYACRGDIVVIMSEFEQWWTTVDREEAAAEAADMSWLADTLQGVPHDVADQTAYDIYVTKGRRFKGITKPKFMTALQFMVETECPKVREVLSSALSDYYHRGSPEVCEAAKAAIQEAHHGGLYTCVEADRKAIMWGVDIDHKDC